MPILLGCSFRPFSSPPETVLQKHQRPEGDYRRQDRKRDRQQDSDHQQSGDECRDPSHVAESFAHGQREDGRDQEVSEAEPEGRPIPILPRPPGGEQELGEAQDQIGHQWQPAGGNEVIDGQGPGKDDDVPRLEPALY